MRRRLPGLLPGAGAAPAHRGERRPERPPDLRAPGGVPGAARHRLHARCGHLPCRPGGRGGVPRARRAPRLEPRRTCLRLLGCRLGGAPDGVRRPPGRRRRRARLRGAAGGRPSHGGAGARGQRRRPRFQQSAHGHPGPCARRRDGARRASRGGRCRRRDRPRCRPRCGGGKGAPDLRPGAAPPHGRRPRGRGGGEARGPAARLPAPRPHPRAALRRLGLGPDRPEPRGAGGVEPGPERPGRAAP